MKLLIKIALIMAIVFMLTQTVVAIREYKPYRIHKRVVSFE